MGGEELRFTGNWFIDAGILGFVNLMEDVYGWDLEKLQGCIKEKPEKVYYGYFPLAYFYDLSTKGEDQDVINKNRDILLEATKEISVFEGNEHKLLELVWWQHITRLFQDKWVKKKLEIRDPAKIKDKVSKELVQKREDLLSSIACNGKCESKLRSLLHLRGSLCKSGKHNLKLGRMRELKDANLDQLPEECKKPVEEALKIHEELKEHLISQWSSLEKIPEKRIKEISQDKSQYFRLPVDSTFFKNFMFFNNSKGILKQLEDLTHLIDGDAEYDRYLQKIDKTLNKFLPSDDKFPNAMYTQFRVEPLVKSTPHLFVYLLSFLSAFTWIRGIGNVLFYGNTLEFTYTVNKRLKVLVSQINDDKNNNNRNSLFKVTWQAVMDSITENRARWSLEDMYLIQYSSMNSQTQSLVGVEYIGIPKLHASIILDDDIRDAINTSLSIDDSYVWLLGEFIKQKPLYPLISKHLWTVLKNKKDSFLNWKASLYALAIDAKLRNERTSNTVFDQAFFERPDRAAVEVKDFYREMAKVASRIKKISLEINGKNIIHPLFSAVGRHNRNAFFNISLKALLQAKSKDKVATINNYLFKRILNNDESWEDFALALIVGLIGGGENAGSGEDAVED